MRLFFVFLFISSFLFADSKTYIKKTEKMVFNSIYFYVNSSTPEYLLKKMQKKDVKPAFFFWHSNIDWIKHHLIYLKDKENLIFVNNSITGITKNQFKELLSYLSFNPTVFQIVKNNEQFKNITVFLKNPYILKLSKKISLQKKKRKEIAKTGSILDLKDFSLPKSPISQSLFLKKSGFCFVNLNTTTIKKACYFDVKNVIIFADEKKLLEFIEKY